MLPSTDIADCIQDTKLEVDICSRFSYETGQRENRLVATPGSTLTLAPEAQLTPADRQALAAASVIGVGEWCEMGFGRMGLTEAT